MDDLTLLALCIYDEAQGEPIEGKRGVARVVTNRQRLHYHSDGTITGTVLAPDQFSGFWFDAVPLAGHWKYVKVCHSLEDAQAHARQKLIKIDEMSSAAWKDCARVAAEYSSPGGSADPMGDPVADRLPGDVVLYYNPAVVLGHPAWATPDAFVKQIGNHAFYRDPTFHPNPGVSQ